ncbi:MAG: nuclear transport factor 2 family protein [Verrucomicrobiaceae bacterium]
MPSRACLFFALFFSACAPSATIKFEDADVRTMLNRYFATWSQRDMDGYGRCFDPQARILFVAKNGDVVSEGVTDFIHGQKLAHEQAATPMTERPLDMKIQGDAKIAQAAVPWILTKGSKEERGTDFFTLRRDGDAWKIVSLVFYAE